MPQEIRGAPPPSPEQYALGLRQVASAISPLQRRILMCHYALPDHCGTATEIAAAAGVAGGHPVVNVTYARLARSVCEAMGRFPEQRTDGTYRWWTVWSWLPGRQGLRLADAS